MALEKTNNFLKYTGSLIIEYLKIQNNFQKKYGENTIVLIQIGGFHECYCTNDKGYPLHKLSNLLNIVVSRKDKQKTIIDIKNPYMMGWPISATPKFLKLLIDNNFWVVKIDQVTKSPNPKRKITGIFSPGTYIDNISNSDANIILSLYIEEIIQFNSKPSLYIGLSTIELSVGNAMIHEITSKSNDDKYSLDECIKFIKNLNPKEIIINTKNINSMSDKELINYLELENNNYFLNNMENNSYDKLNYQNEILSLVYNNSYLNHIDDLNLERLINGRISFIILLDYCYEQNHNIIKNLKEPTFYDKSKYLHMGNNSIYQLNILSQNKTPSLFKIINFTNTNMGRRFLKLNLGNPLCCKKKLNKRYELIDNILENKIYNEIAEILKEVCDIERLHRKIGIGNLNPLDFVNLDDTYNNIIKLYKLIKKTKLINIFDKKTFKSLKEFIKYYNNIFNLDEMNKYLLNDITGSFYNQGIYQQIDKYQHKIQKYKNAMNKIKDEFESLIEDKKKHFNKDKKQKSMIELKYNDKDKYYLTVTTRRSQQIKKKLNNYHFKSQKINKELIQFKIQSNITKIKLNEFNEFSDKIILNTELLKKEISKYYIQDLLTIFEKFKGLFFKISDIISKIDFLNSGALCSVKNKYYKPIIEDYEKSFIEATNIRHPIIEKIISVPYIANDVTIGKDNKDGILLYGLNSAGKSSLMKSIGINIILAQIGYFVASEKFIYNPYNSIFTRIVGLDNIFKGLSSFAYELVELNAILKRSGKHTLVLADEVCKGTEHKSALIIVASMIKKLINSETSFISATHLHKLTKLNSINLIKNLKIYHLDVSYDDNNIVFNRKLKEGNGIEEYGLDFAKYIIKDDDFIKITNEIKNEIENKSHILSIKKSKYNTKIYMDKCHICESKNNLESHHIKFQKDTDEHGYLNSVRHIHKDHKSNLVVLCEKCHDDLHNNKIVIEGYEDTITGKKLVYKKNKITKSNTKFSKEVIDYIKNLKKENNKLTYDKIRKNIKNEKNIKISKSTIAKILKSDYI